MCNFKCLIPNFTGYIDWAKLYSNFNNYEIIKCGELSEDINPLDRANTKWKINNRYLLNNSKIAMLYFGKSFGSYIHWRNIKVMINYNNHYNNHYNNFLKYFDICDIYFSTSYENKECKNNLLKLLNPKQYYFFNEPNMNNINLPENKNIIRNLQFLKSIELCLNSNIDYDYIIISRFDIDYFFNIDILDLEKINIVSEIIKNNQIGSNDINSKQYDDNFYFIPFKFLKIIYNIYIKEFEKRKDALIGHFFLNHIDMSEINYLEKGIKPVANIKLFKLSTKK